MKLTILVLSCVTSALLFGTYVGNETLNINKYNMQRAFTIGCGIGVQYKKNYSSTMTIKENSFCLLTGEMAADVYGK